MEKINELIPEENLNQAIWYFEVLIKELDMFSGYCKKSGKVPTLLDYKAYLTIHMENFKIKKLQANELQKKQTTLPI